MSSDRYTDFINTPIGSKVAKNLGLPMPVELERYKENAPVVTGNVLLGESTGAKASTAVTKILADINAVTYATTDSKLLQAGAKAGLEIKTHSATNKDTKFKVMIFDATGIENSEQLKEVYDFFHPVARQIAKSGRVVILGRTPEECTNAKKATAQRALEGFVKSVGKEFKKGSTAQLIYIADGAEKNLESTLRFFISPRSAYVSGQVVRVSKATANNTLDWNKPLTGKTVVVTGAARGIGEAIARTMAREGAKVVCLDIPPAKADLDKVSNSIDGVSLPCDITAEDAGQKIQEAVAELGGLDAIVHNAGVTRDKTLAKMDDKMWNMVMNINLSSEERVNDYLIANNVLNKNARIVCVSSISGIAGNLGQTNYAMSKAGVIGMVQSTAKELKNGITINAVAPGFIETEMTAKIPFAIREAGRRMNSMNQGGQPVDVAEAICWFASPASSGLNGNVVRVCGQSLLGA